jgi:C_GCAxxG_C_C family probable redox protein
MHIDKASAYFSQGYSCAQSVLLAFAGELGMPAETAVRTAGSFGGGMGRQGLTCGAVTGALMVVGLRHTALDPQDKAAKEHVYELTRRFMADFEKEFGATSCPGLLGYAIGDPEERAKAQAEGLFASRCPLFVQGAARILEEME